MGVDVPSNIPREHLASLILALADDEFVLGHRDSEWTGHAPILEEDIAFSNIAQDEIGHSLVWYALYEQLTGRSPDSVGFKRSWEAFTCCRFVTYPKGDFAYTVVRQYLFDVAEQVRLKALLQSSFEPFRDIAEKLLREEAYHILHIQGLVERLGDATEESNRRMQAALDAAFPQSLGMFEMLPGEEDVVRSGVFPGNTSLRAEWLRQVIPVLRKATLNALVAGENGAYSALVSSDDGGRCGNHTEHLKQLVDEMQSVYRLAPESKW